MRVRDPLTHLSDRGWGFYKPLPAPPSTQVWRPPLSLSLSLSLSLPFYPSLSGTLSWTLCLSVVSLSTLPLLLCRERAFPTHMFQRTGPGCRSSTSLPALCAMGPRERPAPGTRSVLLVLFLLLLVSPGSSAVITGVSEWRRLNRLNIPLAGVRVLTLDMS